MKKKTAPNSDLSVILSEADLEIQTKKREALRARIKPILETREAMEKSIADCEKDLAKAKCQLGVFVELLDEVRDNDDMTALEKLEKIRTGGEVTTYIPAPSYAQMKYTLSIPYSYTTFGNAAQYIATY